MVIRESLEDVSVLDQLTVTRVETWDVSASAIVGQSKTWTATFIEGPDAEADEAGELLSAAMLPGAWYANISTPEHDLVIFKGHVVKYERRDVRAYRAAQDYARSVGVPEHQLGWRSDLEGSGPRSSPDVDR